MPDVVKRRDREIAITRRRLRQSRDLHHIELHIGELIDAAALDPEAWLQVADELRRLVPGTKVTIQAHDPSFGRPLAALAAGWSDGYVEKYNRYFSGMNEVAKAWSNTAPLLTPVLLPEFVFPIDAFLKSEFYNESLKIEGEADCATGIRILSEGRRQATLAIQYGLRHKDEMHECLSPLLQRLAPKLRGALLANRQTIRQKESPLNTDLLQGFVDPALIIDQNCRVISANQPAQNLIASSETLRIGVRNLFSFGERQTDTLFARLLHACGQRAPGSSGYLEFGFVHRDSHFRASILPIARRFNLSNTGIASLFAPDPVVLLVLRCALPPEKSHEFQSCFQLTKAELRIVQALSQEGSLVQIADQLGIAYETARNQLKAALKKTGTHSQRELISLLLQK